MIPDPATFMTSDEAGRLRAAQLTLTAYDTGDGRFSFRTRSGVRVLNFYPHGVHRWGATWTSPTGDEHSVWTNDQLTALTVLATCLF